MGVRLGEYVRVARVCEVAYDDKGERRLFFTPETRDKGFPAAVTGCMKKALGKYVEGRPYPYHGSYDFDDPEPARLKVSKYVWLYECRKLIHTKPFLVHPDDIIIIDGRSNET